MSSAHLNSHANISIFEQPLWGVSCIVATHALVDGVAIGGCRIMTNPNSALNDALIVSRLMSLKGAMAGLNVGGACSVIMLKEGVVLSRRFLEAYGRVLQSLNGRIWMNADIGVEADLFRYAQKHCDYILGLPAIEGDVPDNSARTAETVLRCIMLAVRRKWQCSLSGVSVAIQGTGRVGWALAKKLHDNGANLIVADANSLTAHHMAEAYGARVVDPKYIISQKAEVFSPCAQGGAISGSSILHLKAQIVAGGANNQLTCSEMDRLLFERSILYVPEYVANAGGLINLVAELEAKRTHIPFASEWVDRKIDSLMVTLQDILDRSAVERRPTAEIAYEMAMQRFRPDN